MPLPNDEFQQIEDEYFSQQFDAKLKKLFSFRTLGIALGIIALIAFYSFCATNALHFYPSDWGIAAGLGLSGILALGIMMISVLRSSNRTDLQGATKRLGPLKLLFGSLLVAAFAAPVTFNFCLGLATELMGTPSEQHAIEKSWHSRWRSGGCAGPIIQNTWFGGAITCVDPQRKKEFPPGIHLTLKGKVSLFGMNVEDVMPYR